MILCDRWCIVYQGTNYEAKNMIEVKKKTQAIKSCQMMGARGYVGEGEENNEEERGRRETHNTLKWQRIRMSCGT